MGRAIPWISGATYVFSVPHSIEDLAHGIAGRFGLTTMEAALGLGLVFGLQALLTALAANWRLAALALALLGTFWFAGALFDHGPSLFDPRWRDGPTSKLLVLGVLASDGTLALASLGLAAQWRRWQHLGHPKPSDN